MGIIRQAKSYKVIVNDSYNAVVGGKLYKNANKVIVEALSGDINLSSNKKIIGNGGA